MIVLLDRNEKVVIKVKNRSSMWKYLIDTLNPKQLSATFFDAAIDAICIGDGYGYGVLYYINTEPDDG